MNEFDENILTISKNICKNIASISDNQRGLVSQNILNNLRNLVEAIDQRIYNNIESIELNNYRDIEKSIKYVAAQGQLKFLSRFHSYLQASVSHYTPDEDSAVRLVLKYYEWMLRIRSYCKKTFSLAILENLEDYPLNQDDSLKEYYEKIAYQLDTAHMKLRNLLHIIFFIQLSPVQKRNLKYIGRQKHRVKYYLLWCQFQINTTPV